MFPAFVDVIILSQYCRCRRPPENVPTTAGGRQLDETTARESGRRESASVPTTNAVPSVISVKVRSHALFNLRRKLKAIGPVSGTRYMTKNNILTMDDSCRFRLMNTRKISS